MTHVPAGRGPTAAPASSHHRLGGPVVTALMVALGLLAGCTSRAAPPDSAAPSVVPPTAAASPAAPGRGCIARPSACGYPDATNTGVPAGTKLRPSGSITASQPGQVIDGVDVTGEINVTAPDVTIRNSRVTGGRGAGNADWVIVVRPTAHNLVIEHSEVGTPPGSAQDIGCILNLGDAKPTVRRVHLRGCTAGVSSGGGLVEDTFIHDMAVVQDLSHVVGVASNGGGGLVVRHSTIINQVAQTAAIALYQDFGPQAENLIIDNLVSGGGYCFYGGTGQKGPTRNIRFVGNRLDRSRFSGCGSFGVIASFAPNDPGNEFRDNRWDDDETPVQP